MMPNGRFLPRHDTVVAAAAVLGFTALCAASILYSADQPLLVLVPLGLIGAVLGAWVVAMAFAGSPLAIMAYFAVLTFVNDGQFRVRGAGETDADWQSALKFALWIGAGVIGAGHVRLAKQLLGRPEAVLWIGYILMALVSSLYSPLPGYSFGCALALLCFFGFACALLTRLSESRALWTFAVGMVAFHIGSWVAFYALPELGSAPTWTLSGTLMRMCGLAGQATNLGYLDAQFIGAVFLLWWAGRCSLLMAVLLMGFGAVTLVASDCRTMMLAVVLGIAVVVASRSAWLMALTILGSLLLAVLFMLFPGILSVLGSRFSRSGDAAEMTTLTGRMEIWDFAWSQINESPIIGWGYNSSKVVLGQHLGFENGLVVDNAHNLFLQSLLSVGAVGTVLLIAILLLLIVRLFLRPAPILAFYTVIVCVGAVSDTVAVGTTPTLLTLQLLMISIWPVAVKARARPGASPPPSPRIIPGAAWPERPALARTSAAG
ncbi:O-antigen ligase family protein [Roseomonas elaeocarpi]|uniref:O-antigen ligase family protein n=1 Tax=Roseomonas elaeocarpi TaxID=907779 RepID=A0ABV6JQL5_9PROT